MSDQRFIRVSVKAIIVRDGQVLLVGYDLADGHGFHYNLPGGGAEPGEGLHEALKREAREEVSAEVDVGRLLFVVEYVPAQHANKYGVTPSLGLYFHCALRPGNEPRQPLSPVDAQEGVYWLPLAELHHAPLLPDIGARIQTAIAGNPTMTDPFVADWQ